jgi:hypothetical protein
MLLNCEEGSTYSNVKFHIIYKFILKEMLRNFIIHFLIVENNSTKEKLFDV